MRAALSPRDVEKTGRHFDPAKLLAAREKTFQAVREIAAAIKVGMPESEALELAKGIISGLGAKKNWHPLKVRFGVNTLKHYHELSEPGVRLGADDIFSIDIGPIWDGYEGDGGDTYATGSDRDMARAASDVKTIFAETKKKWSDGATGAELYEFAKRAAENHGWILSFKEPGGHRLSDFPHAVHYRGLMADVDFPPAPYAWMLEIQIRHPTRAFGAFYEDLLF